MVFEGFDGSVDQEKHSITFTLKYEGEMPSKEQQDKDFKKMGDYIAIALALAAERQGDTIDVTKESGETYHLEG